MSSDGVLVGSASLDITPSEEAVLTCPGSAGNNVAALADLGSLRWVGSDLDERAVGEMCSSLETLGQLHPIAVTADGMVIFGAVRAEAARRLGWTTIQAVHHPDVDSSDSDAIALLRLSENGVRGASVDDLFLLGLRVRELLATRKRRAQSLAGSVRHGVDPRSAAPGQLSGSWPAWVSSPVREALDQGASGDEVVRVAVGGRLSRKTLDRYGKLIALSESAPTPELRAEITRLRWAASADGNVDGRLQEAQRLIESASTPTYVVDPEFMEHYRVSKKVADILARVTLGEEHAERVCADPEVIQLVASDREAQLDVEAIADSAERTAATLRKLLETV